MRLHRRRIFSEENANQHIDQSKSDSLKAYRESAKPIGNHPPKKDNLAGYNIIKMFKPRPHQSPPWYMLRKVERIAIESKHASNKMSHNDYIEGYIKHKLAKWEKKHPRPCETDDLFKEEFIPEWENNKAEALKRISQHVHDMYDPVNIDVMCRTIMHKDYEQLNLKKETTATLNCNCKIPKTAKQRLRKIVKQAEYKLSGEIDGLHIRSLYDNRERVTTSTSLAA